MRDDGAGLTTYTRAPQRAAIEALNGRRASASGVHLKKLKLCAVARGELELVSRCGADDWVAQYSDHVVTLSTTRTTSH